MKNLLSAAFLSVSFAACTTIQQPAIYHHGLPAVPAATVKVFHLEKELPERFEKVATFRADFTDEEKGIERAKEQAAQLGANGIYAGPSAGPGFRSVHSSREFIAIRF